MPEGKLNYGVGASVVSARVIVLAPSSFGPLVRDASEISLAPCFCSASFSVAGGEEQWSIPLLDELPPNGQTSTLWSVEQRVSCSLRASTPAAALPLSAPRCSLRHPPPLLAVTLSAAGLIAHSCCVSFCSILLSLTASLPAAVSDVIRLIARRERRHQLVAQGESQPQEEDHEETRQRSRAAAGTA